MLTYLKRFRKDDSGAVTVDWVVLTAAMAGFGIALVTIVSTAASDPAESIGAQLTAMNIE